MKEVRYEDVIENIGKIIKQKGLKQKFIAGRMNMTDQEFSNLMNGKKMLRVEHIPALVDALGVTCNELFCLSGS